MTNLFLLLFFLLQLPDTGLNLNLSQRLLEVDIDNLRRNVPVFESNYLPTTTVERGLWEFESLVEKGDMNIEISDSKIKYNWHEGDDSKVLAVLTTFGADLPCGIKDRELLIWHSRHLSLSKQVDDLIVVFDGEVEQRYACNLFDSIRILIESENRIFVKNQIQLPVRFSVRDEATNTKPVVRIDASHELRDITCESPIVLEIGSSVEIVAELNLASDSIIWLSIDCCLYLSECNINHTTVMGCEQLKSSSLIRSLYVVDSDVESCRFSLTPHLFTKVDQHSRVEGSIWNRLPIFELY